MFGKWPVEIEEEKNTRRNINPLKDLGLDRNLFLFLVPPKHCSIPNLSHSMNPRNLPPSTDHELEMWHQIAVLNLPDITCRVGFMTPALGK